MIFILNSRNINNSPCKGLYPCLSWNPDHSLLASVQTDRRHLQVSFFEKNGLRHGEFPITFSETPLSVSYNSAGDLLAVYSQSCLEIWTRSNYHWYKKQTWTRSIRCIQWDPLDPLQFTILSPVPFAEECHQ